MTFSLYVLSINSQKEKPDFPSLDQAPTSGLITSDQRENSYGPLPILYELGEASEKRHGPPKKWIGMPRLCLLLAS